MISDLERALKLASMLPDNMASVTAPNETQPEREPGQNPPVDPAAHHSGVEIEAKEDREKLIERIFDKVPSFSAEARGVIAQNFSTRDYEAHSPLLKKSAGATLAEQVQRIVGHR